MSDSAGMLPTELLSTRPLPELIANARVFKAAREERTKRVAKLANKDFFEAVVLLLAEIAARR